MGMKVILSVDLDDTWDQYRNMPVKSLLEDIFGYPKKNGIKNINVLNIYDV